MACKFLFKATEHWMNSVPPNIRNQWPQNKKDAYAARIDKGDFVTCQEESHVWGGEEGPPTFGEVIVTDMSVETGVGYLEAVYGTPDEEGNAKKLHRRQYALKDNEVDAIMAAGGTITIATADIPSRIINKL